MEQVKTMLEIVGAYIKNCDRISLTLTVMSLVISIISIYLCIRINRLTIKSNILNQKINYISSSYSMSKTTYEDLDNFEKNAKELVENYKNSDKDKCKQNLETLYIIMEDCYKNNYTGLLILKDIVTELNSIKHIYFKHTYKRLYKYVDNWIIMHLEFFKCDFNDSLNSLNLFTNNCDNKYTDTVESIVNSLLNHYHNIKYTELRHCNNTFPKFELSKIIIELIIYLTHSESVFIHVEDVIDTVTKDINLANKIIVNLELMEYFGYNRNITFTVMKIILNKNLREHFIDYMYLNVNSYRYSRGLKCNKKYKKMIDDINLKERAKKLNKTN